MDTLIEWLQGQIETAQMEINKIYTQENKHLWENYQELAWGCRCRINAYELTLAKIERLKKEMT